MRLQMQASSILGMENALETWFRMGGSYGPLVRMCRQDFDLTYDRQEERQFWYSQEWHSRCWLYSRCVCVLCEATSACAARVAAYQWVSEPNDADFAQLVAGVIWLVKDGQ